MNNYGVIIYTILIIWFVVSVISNIVIVMYLKEVRGKLDNESDNSKRYKDNKSE